MTAWRDDLVKDRYLARCEEFRAGEISDTVFLGYLYSYGFRGRALEDEFQYQVSLKGGVNAILAHGS